MEVHIFLFKVCTKVDELFVRRSSLNRYTDPSKYAYVFESINWSLERLRKCWHSFGQHSYDQLQSQEHVLELTLDRGEKECPRISRELLISFSHEIEMKKKMVEQTPRQPTNQHRKWKFEGGGSSRLSAATLAPLACTPTSLTVFVKILVRSKSLTFMPVHGKNGRYLTTHGRIPQINLAAWSILPHTWNEEDCTVFWIVAWPRNSRGKCLCNQTLFSGSLSRPTWRKGGVCLDKLTPAFRMR